MSRLSEEQGQAIVDGILEGYKEYLNERRDKKEQMKVSYGYTFTKSNHIDHAVSESLNKLVERESVEKTPGGWEYLEFTFNNGERCVFIIKDAIRAVNSTKKGNKESRYLVEKSLVNKEWIIKEKLRKTNVNTGVVIQLSMLDDFEERLINVDEYDRFYLIIYDTNDLKLITNIEVVALDPDTRDLYPIQNLSVFLQTSDITIKPEEASVILGEKETIPEPEEYGLAVPAEEVEGSENI